MFHMPFFFGLLDKASHERFADSLFPVALINYHVFDLPHEAGELLKADERCHADNSSTQQVALYHNERMFLLRHFLESHDYFDEQVFFARVRRKLMNKAANVAHILCFQSFP